MAFKGKGKAKPKYVAKRKTYAPRRPLRSNFDGVNMIASAYFEVLVKNAAGASAPMSYSIRCDPNNLKLKLPVNAVAIGNAGYATDKGDTNPIVATDGSAAVGLIPLQKFGQFKTNYLQYKVNKIDLKVLVDKACLDNQICFSTDRQLDTPLLNMHQVMSAAGKRYIPTESRREFSYGWKPKTTDEREYLTLNTVIEDDKANHLKVFQAMETAAEDTTCIHRVNLMVSFTLKDSKNLN